MSNHLVANQKIENYKGYFFNNDQELKYFESGAHFPFEYICSKLDSLIKTLSPERRGTLMRNNNNSHSNGKKFLNKKNLQIQSLILKREKLLRVILRKY